MAEGYIKLHRKLLDNPIFYDRKILHFWIYCLLSATHTPRKTLLGRREVFLQPGEFVTGRHRAGQSTGLTEKEVRSVISALKTWGMIETKTSQGQAGTIIKIVNWQLYQNCGRSKGQVKSKLGPSEGQVRATIQEGVKEKKPPPPRPQEIASQAIQQQFMYEPSGGGGFDFNKIKALFPVITDRSISGETIVKKLKTHNGDAAVWLAALVGACADSSVRSPMAVAEHRMSSGVDPSLLVKARRALGVTGPRSPKTFKCENCGQPKTLITGGDPGQCGACGGRLKLKLEGVSGGK